MTSVNRNRLTTPHDRSAPGPLSFICVKHDLALAFPDFSRGAWESLSNSGGGVAAAVREEAEALVARL